MRYRLLISGCFILGVAAADVALAQLSGQRGKDWDEQIYEIGSNSTIIVYGRNETTNPRPGNRAGVRIMVDGSVKFNDSIDRTWFVGQTRIQGPGTFNVQLVCTNERADAFRCELSHTREGRVVIE